MRVESTWATRQAKACSRMRSARISRRSAVSFFESSSPTMRRRGLRITAAANTGPKREPRPASSRPAIRCQPFCRAVRSNREEQSRRIGADSSIASGGTTRAMRREDTAMCPTDSVLAFGSRGGYSGGLLGAANASRLALERAQVIKLGATNAAQLQDFDRADHRGVDGKDALDADSKAHSADGKCRAGRLPAPADHNSLKGLQALFIPFAFFQPDVYTYRVAGAEGGDILARLVRTDLIN